MIYFIGEKFLKTHENYSIIDYVQSEITIDAMYISKEKLKILNNVKNNIIVIDNSLNLQNYINKYNKYNFILEIQLKDKNVEEIALEIVQKIENNPSKDYEVLSRVYDQMQSRINYDIYNDVFRKYLKSGNSFLEFGSGTGNVTEKLIQFNQRVLASDISRELLERLNKKYSNIKTQYIDVTNIQIKEKFDCCGMFLDTLNYIEVSQIDKVFKDIYTVLKTNGIFIFDIHSIEKLKAFDGYIEEIDFDYFFFNWLSYQSQDNEITHRFMFINNEIKIEKHRQYIYPLQFYKEKFEKYFILEHTKYIDDRIILVLKKK